MKVLCPECTVRRMAPGEPRCRPCALAARDRFFARMADAVKVTNEHPLDRSTQDGSDVRGDG